MLLRCPSAGVVQQPQRAACGLRQLSGLRRAGPVSAYGNGNGNGYGNGSVAYAPSPSTIASTTTEFSMQPELFSLKAASAPKRASTAAPQPSRGQLPPRTRRVLMAGNWKMNPASAKEAQELAALLASAARTTAQDKPGFDVEVAVIPPFPYLALVSNQLGGTFAKLGAQDVHPVAKGAFTGAVSPGMLTSLGTQFVLAGHSERRTLFGEDDATINKKVHAILSAGMTAILCIGESKQEYEAGQARQVCSRQLRGGLAGVSPADMSRVVIAYEPVWAIGTGLTATPAIAQGVHHFIRCDLAEMYGAEVAQAVRIQYGGSVTPETVDELMACPDIDGCLVGGASLAADKFTRIFSYQPMPGPRRLYAHDAVQCDNNLGESVVWSQRLQRLFWVDSMGQSLWSWDLKSDPFKWQAPEVVGCVALRSDGGLLLGMQSGLYGMEGFGENLQGSWTVTARKLTEFEPGMDTRPNDGRVDRAGNFVVGSYNMAHRQDGKEIGGLWRYTPDGRLHEILDHKVRCSNCVCFSPDGNTMYFTDTPTRRIFAFDYSPNGKLSNRRMLYEMPSALPGGPDGAQTDTQGYLWVCLSGAGQVIRIAPDGTVDTVVELPVASPTCCTIGGPNLDTLYITTRKPDGGALYAVQLPPGVVGVPEPEFGAGGAGLAARGAAKMVGVGSGSGSGAGHAGFCTQCGTPHLSASVRFCHSCGSPRA